MFDPVWPYMPLLFAGVQLTLALTAVAFASSITVGLAIAVARMSNVAPLRAVATVFVNAFLATPVLVQLLWVYYVLPGFGVRLDFFTTLVLTLTANASALMAEIYRSGLQAIDVGQRDAAATLGLSRIAAFRLIVLPQAIRIILPPMGNATITLLKNSSLATFIGAPDLLNEGKVAAILTFRPIEVFTIVGLMYFMLTYPISLIVKRLERRWMVREVA